jgi:hypothetical protein
MSSVPPPSDYFNGINFNLRFYEPAVSLTPLESDEGYLIKALPNTCTVLQTFNQGVSCNSTTCTGTQSVSGLSTLTGGVNTSTIVATTANGVDTQGIVVKSGTTINATLSDAGPLVCKTIQTNSGTVACGNTTITGTQSVSGLSSLNGGLSTSTIVATTANGVDTQGIVVKSGTTTNATLNNAGALVCKTIQINSGTVACGNTTKTGTQSVSGLSTLTGNTSTIVATTANGVDTQGIDVKSGTTTNATLSDAGALVYKIIQTNSGTVACGNTTITGTIGVSGAIDGGAITGTSLSAGAGLISTMGEVKSRLLTVQNASSVTTSTISPAGAITGTFYQLGQE